MSALVDTGSGYTIIRKSTAENMGKEINTGRILPCLQDVTRIPLRILGSVFLEIGIGQEQIHEHWFPVVPDNYLSTDMLLECDVLGQSSLTLNHKRKTMLWGNTSYAINLISKRKGKVEKITQIPPQVKESAPTNSLNITKTMIVPPYQIQFVSLAVNEIPGTTVIVHPQGKVSGNRHPFCTSRPRSEHTLPFCQ